MLMSAFHTPGESIRREARGGRRDDRGLGAILARIALLVGTLLAATMVSVLAGACTQAQSPSPPAGPGAPTPGPTSPAPAIPATPVPLGAGQVD
jgi:hypothetical protein